MSVALMAVAFRTSLPPTRKLVLLALCDAANDVGECYPSVSHLVAKCSLAERTVQAAILELEQGGFLHRQQRAGRSTVYLMTPDLSTPPQQVHPRSRRTPAARAPTPATGAPPPPQQVHPTPATGAPITVTEPSVEPPPKRGERGRAPDGVAGPGPAPAPAAVLPPPPPAAEGPAVAAACGGGTLAGQACRAIRAAGIVDANPGHPDLLRLLAAQVPVADLEAAARDLVGKGKGRFALLLATVEGRLRDAAAKGAMPDVQVPWHESRSGIEAKGRELGLGVWDEYAAQRGQGEQWPAYQARVFAKAGCGPDGRALQ